MSVELVIFDMDGLMFDTESVSYHAWAKKIEEMGKVPSIGLFSKSMGGHEKGIEAHYEALFGRETTIEEINRIFEESDVEFAKMLERDGIGIKKGLLELLDWLEDQGIKKVIASSSSRKTIDKYLEATGVKPGRFDYIMSGDMVKNLKPDPEIFLKACEHTDTNTATALVLEDSRNGLNAACNAGIRCVFVPDLLEPDEEIKNKAFKIADSLLDIKDIIRQCEL